MENKKKFLKKSISYAKKISKKKNIRPDFETMGNYLCKYLKSVRKKDIIETLKIFEKNESLIKTLERLNKKSLCTILIVHLHKNEYKNIKDLKKLGLREKDLNDFAEMIYKDIRISKKKLTPKEKKYEKEKIKGWLDIFKDNKDRIMILGFSALAGTILLFSLSQSSPPISTTTWSDFTLGPFSVKKNGFF